MNPLAEKAGWLRLFILALFGGFIVRLFFLQIVSGPHYQLLAERNRFQIFYRQAPRGLILDRHGYALASNTGVFNLYYNPLLLLEGAQERWRQVAAILGLRPAELGNEIKEAARMRRTRPVAWQISPERAFRFFEREEAYPEFFLASESLRAYPMEKAFSHVLGYLSRIQSYQDYEKLKAKGYRFDSWIGGFGLEKKFEEDLRGTDGAVLIEVDARGHPIGFSDQSARRQGGSDGLRLAQDPYPGRDLHLTVDGRLIEAAHQALLASPTGIGSVVGIEPETGRILVIAATPGFDPNAYISLTSTATESSGVEFPRAITGLYSPGSTFKVITSIAALEKGLDPNRQYRCNGKFILPTKEFKCWKKEGHGTVDFLHGLANSCNVYFYNAGLFAGGEALSSWALGFGLGTAFPVQEFPEWTKTGFVPTPKWKETKKRDSWHPGDSCNLAIGQGEALVTAVQLAGLYAMVANQGTLPELSIVDSITNPTTDQVLWTHAGHGKIAKKAPPVSDSTWTLLEEGLRRVVEEGTATRARIPGRHIYGKTGTAQNPHGEDHALFGCYLKDEGGRPRLALSIIIEQGGHGGSAAVPVARRVLEEFIRIEEEAGRT